MALRCDQVYRVFLRQQVHHEQVPRWEESWVDGVYHPGLSFLRRPDVKEGGGHFIFGGDDFTGTWWSLELDIQAKAPGKVKMSLNYRGGNTESISCCK